MWRTARLQSIMDGTQSAIAVVPRYADKVTSFRLPALASARLTSRRLVRAQLLQRR